MYNYIIGKSEILYIFYILKSSLYTVNDVVYYSSHNWEFIFINIIIVRVNSHSDKLGLSAKLRIT